MQQTKGKNESDFGNIDSQNRNDNEEESKKGHRRSKNDTEGRTYKCKQCGQSYLSYPALYTHTVRQSITLATMESSILKELDTIHWKLLTF